MTRKDLDATKVEVFKQANPAVEKPSLRPLRSIRNVRLTESAPQGT